MNDNTSQIVLTGTLDLSPVQNALHHWCQRFAWKVDIVTQPALTDPTALVDQGLGGQDGIRVLVVRASDWAPCSSGNQPGTSASEAIAEAAKRFTQRLRERSHELAGKVIVLLAPSEAGEAPHVFQRIEDHLCAAFSDDEGVHLCRFPERQPRLEQGSGSNMPLFPELAMMLARQLYRLRQPGPRLLVVHDAECLWHGNPAPEASAFVKAPHRDLQEVLRHQRASGVHLAIVSDRDQESLRYRFRENSGMILREDDIAAWGEADGPVEAKIQNLASALDIPLHRTAFLSRDEKLIDRLRTGHPEILSIALPGHEEAQSEFLQHLWFLDGSLSAPDAEDEKPGQMQAETQHWSRQLESFADRLDTLGATVEKVSPTAEHHALMAELTQETSRIHATARKFTAEEIGAWLGQPYHYAVCFQVSDTTADHGIVGLIMFERVKLSIIVHNFVLKDSMLGMGVEAVMLSELGHLASQHQCIDIDLPFLRAADNVIMPAFFPQTLEAYRQELPEENWSIYQIPATVAKTITGAPLSAEEISDKALTTPLGPTMDAHSDIIQDIATNRISPTSNTATALTDMPPATLPGTGPSSSPGHSNEKPAVTPPAIKPSIPQPASEISDDTSPAPPSPSPDKAFAARDTESHVPTGMSAARQLLTDEPVEPLASPFARETAPPLGKDDNSRTHPRLIPDREGLSSSSAAEVSGLSSVRESLATGRPAGMNAARQLLAQVPLSHHETPWPARDRDEKSAPAPEKAAVRERSVEKSTVAKEPRSAAKVTEETSVSKADKGQGPDKADQPPVSEKEDHRPAHEKASIEAMPTGSQNKETKGGETTSAVEEQTSNKISDSPAIAAAAGQDPAALRYDVPQLQARFEAIEGALDALRGTVFLPATDSSTPNPAPPACAADYFEDWQTKAEQASPKSQVLIRQWVARTGEVCENRPQLLVHRRHGGNVWDADDRRYVDMSSAILPHWLGYEAPEIKEACRQYLRCDEPEAPVHLHLQITELLSGLSQTTKFNFTKSSAEALELGFALARRKTNGRPGIGILKSTANEAGSSGTLVALAADDPRLTAQIHRRRHELAAILIAPLELAHLDDSQRMEILTSLRRETERCGMALILDERVSAFRWGIEEGRNLETLRPDLIVYGESLSDGLPLGILTGRETWFTNNVSQRHPEAPDSSGSALPLVAARATLQILKQSHNDTLKSLRERTKTLTDAMQSCVDELEAPLNIGRLGSLFSFMVMRDPEQACLLEAEALLQGIRLSIPTTNTTVPAHSQEDLDHVATAFRKAVDALQDRGFLLRDAATYEARLAIKQDSELLTYWKQILEKRKLTWPEHYHTQTSTTSLKKTAVHRLPATLLPALRERAQSWDSSLDELLTAAFHTLFRAWSGSHLIAFLTEFDGQAAPLCLPGDSLTLRQTVEAVRASKTNAREHLLYHPDTFAEWLLDHGPASGIALENPHINLRLHWQLKNNALQCTYDTGLYDAQQIDQWLKCFAVLLEGFAVREPGIPAAELPLLSNSEREIIVTQRNVTTRSQPPREPVHQLFESVAAKTPHRIAVRYGQEKISYGDLDARANHLARALAKEGVGAGDTVAILASASPRMIEGWLAVLKLGAAYLPLDPAHKAKPQTLASSKVRFLLTDGDAAAGSWAGDPARVLDMQSLISRPDSGTTIPPNADGADTAATVLFHWDDDTPSPVRLTHGGLVGLVKCTESIALDAHEVFLLGGSSASDRCLLEVWGPLLNGGMVAIPQGESSPANLAETIRTHRVSSLVLDAHELHGLIETYADDLSWIRQIVVIGKLPARDIIRRILQSLPARLIATFGPMENTLLTCSHELTEEDLESSRIPLGRPVPHSQLYVLNEAKHPVPPGMPGDLWVGGNGMALIPDGAPEDRVIESPFAASPGHLFRTGDRAQWLPSGKLVLLEGVMERGAWSVERGAWSVERGAWSNGVME